MKIIFVYKGRYFVQDVVVIETLSAIAKRYGHETFLLFDQDVFGSSDNVISSPWLHRLFTHPERFEKELSKIDPDLIVFYDPIHLNERWNFSFIDRAGLSRYKVKTVCLSYFEVSDPGIFNFVLLGEPEHTFNVFLRERHYLGNQSVFHDSRLADLNALPVPDKELFAGHIDLNNSYLIFTSKGCPASCSYCIETVLKDHIKADYFRQRSPANVLEELLEAKRLYGVKEIIYKDSIFTFNKDWLKEYLSLYRDHIDLPYKCFAKVGNFDLEIANMLKYSRCYCVEFGVQTFNESIKRDVLDRVESVAALKRAFAICDQVQLQYDVDHLFGVPGECVDDHLMAAKVYVGLQSLNRIKCHNLVVYPNAKISRYFSGKISDEESYQAGFFSFVAGSSSMKAANACFQKYFKVLPLLPIFMNDFLQNKNRWNIFRFVPNVVIIVIMFILAVKNGDKRFEIYVKYYFIKVFQAIVRK